MRFIRAFVIMLLFPIVFFFSIYGCSKFLKSEGLIVLTSFLIATVMMVVLYIFWRHKKTTEKIPLKSNSNLSYAEMKEKLPDKVSFVGSDFNEGSEYSKEDIAFFKQQKIESKYFYPKKVENTNVFNQKKVVISGEFSQYLDRNVLAERLWNLGADIDAGVTKKTNFLIVGINYGPSKMQKAKDYNVNVIFEDELDDLLES